MQTAETRVAPNPNDGAGVPPPAVETRRLRKRYGSVIAVDGVDLAIGSGEIFGLLGPNGAGKTTTIKMLLGLARPTEGYAAVFGYQLPNQANHVRQLVGYVTQEVALDRVLTARENLRLVAALYHVPGREANRRIEELLTFADLTARGDSIVRDYSGGMRKRLDLVMGLVHQPRLLILDEPTLGLDIQTRRRLWAYVRSLREEHGLTILLTTHYLDEADQLCDRVAIIDQGKIVAIGPPDQMKAALGGDIISLTLGGEVQKDGAGGAETADQAIELIRRLTDVRDAAAVGETVRATVSGAERTLPVVLAALKGAGIEVAGVSYSRPTLDDVFLYHTGHSLREG